MKHVFMDPNDSLFHHLIQMQKVALRGMGGQMTQGVGGPSPQGKTLHIVKGAHISRTQRMAEDLCIAVPGASDQNHHQEGRPP